MVFLWFSPKRRGERELMGLCSRSLAWAERDYRLVSTGSQANGKTWNEFLAGNDQNGKVGP